MQRPSNAVDFWRGFALVTIFINHIPGILYERLTHRNFSFSDSAELFVFLAGWSLRYVVGGRNKPVPALHIMLRLAGRALTLYASHILVVMIAIAMLAYAADILENPLLLEWHNAAAVFYDPARTHIGLIILSHQLGYFNILPLYVLLLLLAPFIALMHRTAPLVLLPLSFLIYLTAIIFEINIPTWPAQGYWFFNPLCWQFIFILGFSLSLVWSEKEWLKRNMPRLRVAATPIVVAGAVYTLLGLSYDPTQVPDPKLLFLNAKAYLTPIRLIQFLALITVFSVVFPYLVQRLPKFCDVLSMLGRNSLHVFAASSVLSLLGQILRFYFGGGFLVDTVIVMAGVIAMITVAWLAEWRDRV